MFHGYKVMGSLEVSHQAIIKLFGKTWKVGFLVSMDIATQCALIRVTG